MSRVGNRFITRAGMLLLATTVGVGMLGNEQAVSAQAVHATLMGRVTDGSGAVLPDVRMTLAGAAGGEQRETTSNERGEYAFRDLPSGRYVLSAAADGFAPLQVTGIVLAEGEQGTLPVSLKVAPLIESVSVQGAAADDVSIGRAVRSLREVPQSVSVVTREQMDAWNAVTIADALEHVVGVTIEPFGNGAIDFSTRGFGVSSIQLDGLPTEAGFGSYTTSGLDMAAYERIEVQRGSAGLFQGSGEPGGVINLVRKRAQPTFAMGGAVMAGSWNTYRAEIDVTGPLIASGALRGRLVGAYEDRDSFIDHVYARTPMVYGTLEYDLTDSVTAAVGASYQGGESRPVFGLPTYADGRLLDVPRSTYLGSLWDRQTEDTERYFVDVDHQWANGGEWRLRLDLLDRNNSLKYSSFGTRPVTDDNGVIGVNRFDRTHRRLDRSAEWYASVPVRLVSESDSVLFGVTYRDFTHTEHRLRAPAGTRDVFAPDPNTPEPVFTFDRERESLLTERGAYGRVRLRVLPALTVMGGGRFGEYEASQVEVGKFVPYAGLVYDLSDALSAYASYSSIFDPQAAVDRFGEILPPRSGDQIEGGVNGELRHGLLTLHAAVFQIADRNRAIDDPVDPLFSIASGEVRSRGFEAEVRGRPAAGWSMSGGYAFTDTFYHRDTPEQEGTIFAPGTPRHAVTLWSRYDFVQQGASGAFVGGGLRVSSGVFAEIGDVRFAQDAYALLSAHAGYRFSRQLTVQVEAENLTDTTYYARVSGGGRQTYYGEPRRVLVTLRVSH